LFYVNIRIHAKSHEMSDGVAPHACRCVSSR
jgi:hypothetical protein